MNNPLHEVTRADRVQARARANYTRRGPDWWFPWEETFGPVREAEIRRAEQEIDREDRE